MGHLTYQCDLPDRLVHLKVPETQGTPKKKKKGGTTKWDSLSQN